MYIQHNVRTYNTICTYKANILPLHFLLYTFSQCSIYTITTGDQLLILHRMDRIVDLITETANNFIIAYLIDH